MIDQNDAIPPDSDDSDDGYPRLPQDVPVWQGLMEEYMENQEELDAIADDPGIQCVFKHQDRKGIQQNMTEVLATRKAEALSIIELFSPRRFADLAELFGMVSRGSFDLSDGWNFNVRAQRLHAEETVKCVDPRSPHDVPSMWTSFPNAEPHTRSPACESPTTPKGD